MINTYNVAETTKKLNRKDKVSSKKESVEEKTEVSFDMPKEDFPSNIVCLGMAEWEGMHLSYHHATEELVRMGFGVVYVCPPLDLARCLNILFRWRNPKPLAEWFKKINIFKKPEKLKKNFLIALGVPLLLGFGFWGIVDYLNQKLVWWYLKRLVRKAGLNEYILYTSTYFPTKINDKRCKLFVYDCMDELSCMTSIERRKLKIRDLERRMLKQVDAFFAISRSLLSEKSKINPHGFYAPPSIDFNRFTLHKENTDLKKSLQALDGPLIGLLASMSNQKIAWDTLLYAAVHRPDCRFVFAGSVQDKVPEPLRNLKNVFFLGPQKEEDLPTLLGSFDVGLIPFNRNTFGDNAFPTKMPEYLFFGMPVVSTDIPNLREYEGIIEIARDKEEFAKKIDECLTQNHDKKSYEKRKQISKRFSKEQRTKEILEKMRKIWEMKLNGEGKTKVMQHGIN
jgi:glycosyltransferase involved in cell wall biosynthesis